MNIVRPGYGKLKGEIILLNCLINKIDAIIINCLYKLFMKGNTDNKLHKTKLIFFKGCRIKLHNSAQRKFNLVLAFAQATAVRPTFSDS